MTERIVWRRAPASKRSVTACGFCYHRAIRPSELFLVYGLHQHVRCVDCAKRMGLDVPTEADPPEPMFHFAHVVETITRPPRAEPLPVSTPHRRTRNRKSSTVDYKRKAAGE